jgi:hypothetical protein
MVKSEQQQTKQTQNNTGYLLSLQNRKDSNPIITVFPECESSNVIYARKYMYVV